MKCLTPLVIENPKYKLYKDFQPWLTRYIKVPCGKCVECIVRYILGWAFRLELEKRVSTSVGFYTITYNDENLPFDGVSKSDIQKLFKRMRKKYNIPNFKYLLISEYGPNGGRAHYHGVFFNVNPDIVSDCWNKGFVSFGDLSYGRIMYCLSYHFLKGFFVPEGCNPNFKIMSNKLGLDAYVKYERVNAVNNDYRFLVNEKGQKIAVPRYFRDKDGYKFPPDYFENLVAPSPMTKQEVDNFNSVNYMRTKKYILNLLDKKRN